MKENEIRIGNLFEHDGSWCYRDFTKPTIFAWNSADWHALGECTLSLDNIKPIELTEEWLIRLGFEEEKGYYVRKFGVFTFAIYRVSSDEFNAPYLPFTTIKYLHHFQNIIHALTGTEI